MVALRDVLVAFGVRNSGGNVAFQQGIIRRVFQNEIGFHFGKKLVHHRRLLPYSVFSLRSGEVVYSLRCSLLHEGNPNLQKNGKHPIPIDRFSLVIQSEQPFRIYGGEGSSVLTSSDGTEVRSYRVNVRRLCMVLCLCAKGYYKENKDKFDFYNYELIDWDEVTASLPPIDMEEVFRKLADPNLS